MPGASVDLGGYGTGYVTGRLQIPTGLRPLSRKERLDGALGQVEVRGDDCGLEVILPR